MIGPCESRARASGELQAGITAATGYDSNPPVENGGHGLFFADLRPQLALRLYTPRVALNLDYTFLATLYYSAPRDDTFGQRLELTAMVELTPTALLELSASALYASFLNYTVVPASDVTPIAAIPSASSYFFSTRESELFVTDLTAKWRLAQSAIFTSLQPIDNAELPVSYELDQLISLERRFHRDAIAGLLRFNVVRFLQENVPASAADPTGPTMVESPDRELILIGVEPRWRHDFNPFISGELEAGPLLVLRGSRGNFGDEKPLVEPVGRAALHYVRPEGQVDFQVLHDVQANPFVGGTFINTLVSLGGSVPLPPARVRLSLAATVAYQHEQLIDISGTLDEWLADLTVAWTPRPDLQLFARYQFLDQIGPTVAIMPVTSVPVATFERHVVLVGLTYTFTSRTVPLPMPRSIAHSVRADQSDGRLSP